MEDNFFLKFPFASDETEELDLFEDIEEEAI